MDFNGLLTPSLVTRHSSLKKKTGSFASEFQSQRNCLHFIHQTRMYVGCSLTLNRLLGQSVELRRDIRAKCRVSSDGGGASPSTLDTRHLSFPCYCHA